MTTYFFKGVDKKTCQTSSIGTENIALQGYSTESLLSTMAWVSLKLTSLRAQLDELRNNCLSLEAQIAILDTVLKQEEAMQVADHALEIPPSSSEPKSRGLIEQLVVLESRFFQIRVDLRTVQQTMDELSTKQGLLFNALQLQMSFGEPVKSALPQCGR